MADSDGRMECLVIINAPEDGAALSTVLTALPDAFPTPVVILLAPAAQALPDLTGFLAGHTSLPTHLLGTDTLALEPGHIYIVPSDHNARITHESIAPDEHRGVASSAMQSVRSAAEVFGENLVAVLLDTTATDGAEELYEVKHWGGTVVIQKDSPGLPPGLPITSADLVVPVEDIGRLVHDLVRGYYISFEPDDEVALRTLLEQLRDSYGIDFSTYKRPTILRRLQRRMADTGQSSIVDYVRYVRSHPDETQGLVSTFLIKVTEFFRDPQLFDYLREHILPAVIATSRQRDYELRFWSAGCATGEEAYSLAILIAELLGDELDKFRVRIFATDLDADAVEFARHGIYPASALGEMEPELVEKYFTPVENGYQIRKRVRALTVFGHHDLSDRAPFPRIDLLTCRNVLIYFTSDLQRRVLQLFAFSLRDGGYLVLGKSETVSPLATYFVPDNGRLKVFRRRGDRMLIPPTRIRETSAANPTRYSIPRQLMPEPETSRPERGIARPPTLRERSENLLLLLPIGVVGVNRQYDIQMINNAARRILSIHNTALDEDVVHLSQDLPSREFRRAIDAAFHGTESVLHDIPVSEPSGGPVRYYQITVSPEPAANHEPPEMALIMIVDVTEQVHQRQGIERALEEVRADVQRMTGQMERLTETNRDLLAANQELTVTNMELRSSNEEFLVGNEELQAASEEVETLNEELQATNEELETLNEELQATVEELNTTNDDLQARSAELEELAASLEQQRSTIEIERARLEVVLSSMADAVSLVDREGRILLTNPAYDQMLSKRDGLKPEVGGRALPESETPWARAARGESFVMEFTADGRTGTRRVYEATGRPNRIGEEEGGVVVIRDITARSSQQG